MTLVVLGRKVKLSGSVTVELGAMPSDQLASTEFCNVSDATVVINPFKSELSLIVETLRTSDVLSSSDVLSTSTPEVSVTTLSRLEELAVS